MPSLAEALRILREQAARTPAPQWVRVIGGWTEFQFAERRMPTLDEINTAAPDTPVFVLHLYDSALLNAAALRAIGYTKDTPNPPGGEIKLRQKRKPHWTANRKAEVLILPRIKNQQLEIGPHVAYSLETPNSKGDKKR